MAVQCSTPSTTPISLEDAALDLFTNTIYGINFGTHHFQQKITEDNVLMKSADANDMTQSTQYRVMD